MQKFPLAAAGMAAALSAVFSPAEAAGREDYIKAYTQNKSAALSGLRPETRSEFVRCMMVWGYQALQIDDNPEYEVGVHPDLTMETANSHYSHWWGEAERSYGVERLPAFAAKMMEITDSYYEATSYLGVYADLGTCFVPADQRTPFERLTPMEVMPSNGTAAVPLGLVQRLAGVRETGLAFVVPEDFDMLENIVDGTIAVHKKRRFKGLQRVTVPHFAVSFGLADSAQTRTRSSNNYASGTSISAAAEISGLTEPVLQSLTDFAYQDFLQKMAAAGYEVMPGPQSQQMLLRNKLNRTTVSSEPVRNLSVYHNAFNPNFKDITFAPQGMSLFKPMWEASMATKKLGVPALNVQYSVHFAWFEGQSSKDRRAFSGNETLSSSMGTNLNVQVIYSSGVELLGDTAGNPKFSVEGTFYSNEPYWNDYDVSNTGGGSRKRMEVSVEATDWAYYYEAMKTLARTNTALVSQMAAAR